MRSRRRRWCRADVHDGRQIDYDGSDAKRPDFVTVLSDKTIRLIGSDLIYPFDPERVQPSSVDLTLSNVFRIPERHHCAQAIHLDGHKVTDITRELILGEGETFVLHPGEFVLGATREIVSIPTDLVCRIEGKSSLGRVGLIVHATAGFVDLGFHGALTLEMANFFPVPLVLYPGMAICQISFQHLDGPATPYSGRYQGDTTVAPSRFGQSERK